MCRPHMLFLCLHAVCSPTKLFGKSVMDLLGLLISVIYFYLYFYLFYLYMLSIYSLMLYDVDVIDVGDKTEDVSNNMVEYRSTTAG